MADPIKHVLVGDTTYDIYDQRIRQITADDATVSTSGTTTTFTITAGADSELTNGALLLVQCAGTLVVSSTYPYADIKYGSSGTAHHVSDSAAASASDVSAYFADGKVLLLSYNADDEYWHLLSAGGASEDTKVTNTLQAYTQHYITGTTVSTTNTGTQIFTTSNYIDATGRMHSNSYVTSGPVQGGSIQVTSGSNTYNIAIDSNGLLNIYK